MKFKFLGLVAILAAICLICSCGNGSSDSENAAPKTVALSFAVNADNGDALRALSVTNPEITVAKYQYKATAKFSSEFGTPQGDTAGAFVDFVNSETGEAGIFAQGKWEFEVQGLDASGAVVCATAEKLVTYVNASTTKIEVVVVRQFASGTGTLIINGVTAPTYSYDASSRPVKVDKLVITGGPADYTIDAAVDTDGVKSTFTKTFERITAGIYTMTFTVQDSAGNAVGSALKIVEIVNGQTTTVTGSIDSGKWLTETLKVAEKTIELVITAPTEAQSVTAGGTVTFTCKGTIKAGDTPVTDRQITYNLYVGGSVKVTGSGVSGAATSLEWDTTDVAPGYYYAVIEASYSNEPLGENLKTDGGKTILVIVNPAE